MRGWRALAGASLLSAIGCATAGSSWMAEPLTAGSDEEGWNAEPASAAPMFASRSRPSAAPDRVVVINEPGAPEEESEGEPGAAPPKLEGRVLGSFRNTYYDFPSEAEHKGQNVPLKDSRCKTIADVPRGFYEAVCVQGSGTLKRGSTVSFAKRDCECAEICPRTQQKICFDELDKSRFPWGRGATGNPITPLLSVAVDTDVIPMNTPIYIPEYDGLPRDADKSASHDGCFVAQDRGLKIKGKHVDVFTGYEAVTKLWNRLVPSNKGVTVVLDSPRCARASSGLAEPAEDDQKKPQRRP
jgi:3D (Asp-Asp-Asp) domain-containing protein